MQPINICPCPLSILILTIVNSDHCQLIIVSRSFENGQPWYFEVSFCLQIGHFE